MIVSSKLAKGQSKKHRKCTSAKMHHSIDRQVRSKNVSFVPNLTNQLGFGFSTWRVLNRFTDFLGLSSWSRISFGRRLRSTKKSFRIQKMTDPSSSIFWLSSYFFTSNKFRFASISHLLSIRDEKLFINIPTIVQHFFVF